MNARTGQPHQHAKPLHDMGWLAEPLFGLGPFVLALLDCTLHYVRVSHAFADVLGHEARYFPGKHAGFHGVPIIP